MPINDADIDGEIAELIRRERRKAIMSFVEMLSPTSITLDLYSTLAFAREKIVNNDLDTADLATDKMFYEFVQSIQSQVDQKDAFHGFKQDMANLQGDMDALTTFSNSIRRKRSKERRKKQRKRFRKYTKRLMETLDAEEINPWWKFW